jgi:hypothetical protein
MALASQPTFFSISHAPRFPPPFAPASCAPESKGAGFWLGGCTLRFAPASGTCGLSASASGGRFVRLRDRGERL